MLSTKVHLFLHPNLPPLCQITPFLVGMRWLKAFWPEIQMKWNPQRPALKVGILQLISHRKQHRLFFFSHNLPASLLCKTVELYLIRFFLTTRWIESTGTCSHECWTGVQWNPFAASGVWWCGSKIAIQLRPTSLVTRDKGKTKQPP